jgi:hypothetical protein
MQSPPKTQTLHPKPLTPVSKNAAVGYKDERILLENFDHVVRAFHSLKPEYQVSTPNIKL